MNKKDLANIVGLKVAFDKSSQIGQRQFMQSLKKTLKHKRDFYANDNRMPNRNIKER